MTTTQSCKPRYGECGHCGARIDLDKAREAELSVRGVWYASGAVPEGEESQGCFDVGATCYRRVVRGAHD
jgi:hypothetical protein